jgi:hypothetical protein
MLDRRANAATSALVGVGILLLLALLALFQQYLRWPFAFNSDDLYCDALCEDILAGREMFGQHIPGAPYLFPDVLLLLPCHALSDNLVVVYSLYCYLFYLLMLAALTAIIRALGFGWRRTAFAAAIGLLFFVAANLHQHYDGRRFLLAHPGNHLGASLVGLVLLGILIRSLRGGFGWVSAASVILLGSLGAYSDKLLIVQYLVPLALALGVLAACRFLPVGRFAGMVASLGASLPLASALGALVRSLGIVALEIDTSFHKFQLDDVVAFGCVLLRGMYRQDVLRWVIVAHLLAALTVLVVYLYRARRNIFRVPPAQPPLSLAAPACSPLRTDAVLFLASAVLFDLVCNLGALLCTGIAEEGIERYSLPRVLLSFVFLGVFLQVLPGRGARWAYRLLDVAIVAFAIYRLVPLLSTVQRHHFQTPYPPLAQELDRLSRLRGPLRGLAGFWTARHIHFMTRQRVVIRPISAEGGPWSHADNPNHYLSSDKSDLTLPLYTFIIVSPERDPTVRAELLAAEYGEPSEKIRVGTDEIWFYPCLDHPWLMRFLHAQLAPRLRRQRPFVAPVWPVGLAKPKRNLSIWAGSDNVAIGPAGSLEVRFAEPVCGRLLDIGANATDRFDLVFYHGPERVGALRVASVPWTGAAYGPGGLRSRLIPVPAAWRERKWDRVVVSSLNLVPSVLDHFLLYQEDVLPADKGPTVRPLALHFEGENQQIGPGASAQTVQDRKASGGAALQAPPLPNLCFAHGPYIRLPAGRYQVDFALRVEGEMPAGPLATIDVLDGGPFPVVARPLYASDFLSSKQYPLHRLTFESPVDLDSAEFRVSSTGAATLTLDYIDVIRLP